MSQSLEYAPPIDDGHHDIQEHQVWAALLDPLERLQTVLRGIDRPPGVTEDVAKEGLDVFLVVDHEDPPGHVGHRFPHSPSGG